MRRVQKKETSLKKQERVRAGSICQTECFISTDIPGLKKKKKMEGFNISSHPTGSKTPIQELRAPSEASLESLLAPRQKGAEFSNFC